MTDLFQDFSGEEIVTHRRGPDSKDKRRKWYMRGLFYWIVSGVVLTPLLLIAYIANVANANESSVSEFVQPAGRAAAADILHAWIAGEPMPYSGAKASGDPIPGAVVTEWIDFTQDLVDIDGTIVETHYFGVLISGVPYRAGLQVAIHPAGGIEVKSIPNLVPATASSESSEDMASWPGADQYAPSDAMKSSAQLWADAYFSGDPVKLQAVTSDPSPEHAYTPLSGFSVVSVSVPFAGQSGIDPASVFARVEITATTSSGSKLAMDFDVLMNRADTATPIVVAWGAAGSGPRLTAYINATGATGSSSGVSAPAITVPVTAPVTAAPTVAPTEAATTAAPTTVAAPVETVAAPVETVAAPVETVSSADPSATIPGAGVGG